MKIFLIWVMGEFLIYWLVINYVINLVNVLFFIFLKIFIVF